MRLPLPDAAYLLWSKRSAMNAEDAWPDGKLELRGRRIR